MNITIYSAHNFSLVQKPNHSSNWQKKVYFQLRIRSTNTKMNQAELARLVSKLRFKIQPRHRNMKTIKGPEHRLFKIGQIVTGLIKYERLELNWIPADEARGYAERVSVDNQSHHQ